MFGNVFGNMSYYLSSFVPLVTLILIGYFSRELKLFNKEAIKPFNKLVVTFALPCLVFTTLCKAKTDFFNYIPKLVFIGLIAGIVTGTVTFLIFRKYSNTKKFSLIIPTMMGQTAFMGYPIVKGVWNDQGLIIAILYDISTYLTFSILKIILTATLKNEPTHTKSNVSIGIPIEDFNKKKKPYIKPKDQIKDIIKSIVTIPILWAILFGIIFILSRETMVDVLKKIPNLSGEETMVFVLNKVLNYLANVATPLVMILLGITLDLKAIRINIKKSTVIALLKLILFPSIVFILATLLHLPDYQKYIILIEAAMPCALISLNLGIGHDLDYKLISDCIITAVIFSIVTIFIIFCFLPNPIPTVPI